MSTAEIDNPGRKVDLVLVSIAQGCGPPVQIAFLPVANGFIGALLRFLGQRPPRINTVVTNRLLCLGPSKSLRLVRRCNDLFRNKEYRVLYTLQVAF